MTQRRRRILIALAVAGATVLAIGVGVRTLLPSWLRGNVERVASQALGRELKIAGPFEVSFSLTPKVTAGGITLANMASGSQPGMLLVGRVAVALDLRSLWSPPVRVRELEIEDVSLLLEADGEGRGNWVFAPQPPPSEPRAPAKRPPVECDRATIRGLELNYRPRPDAPPVRLSIREFAARLDPPTRMLEVDGGGVFDGAPWQIAGRLGTLDKLYEIRDIDQVLAGRIGEARVEIQGHLREPLALGEPDLDVSVEGPDIVAALGHFGLHSPLTGAVRFRGRFTPAKNGVDIDVKAALGGVSARAHGVVRTLLALDRIDVAVEAAGPDASAVGAWIGVEGLPARAFDLSGRVRRVDGRLSLDDTLVRVGPTSLKAAGVLGAPPRWVGTKLAVQAKGTDLAELARLVRLRLPPGPFEVRGRLLRRAEGLAIDGIELSFRDAWMRAGGTIGEPPRLANLDLTIDAAGPDLAWFSELAGVGPPQRPFEVRGRVRVAADGSDLDGVEGSVGRVAAAADGRIGSPPALDGTSLACRVQGLALAELAAWGLPDKRPGDPFAIAGRLSIENGVYHADGVAGNVGPDRVEVDGVLGALPDLALLDAGVDAGGPSFADLGRFATAAGFAPPAGVPAGAYAISGRVRRSPVGYVLDQVRAKVAETVVGVDGTVGSGKDMGGTSPRIDASGPDLAAALGSVTGLPLMPAEAFEVSADLAGSLEQFASERFSAHLGGNDLDGRVALRLGKRPVVEAELRSKRLDLSGLLAGLGVTAPAGAEAATEVEAAPAEPGLLLSDDPLPVAAFQEFDATLQLEAADLAIGGLALRDVVVDGGLREGTLRVDRVEGSGL